MGRRRGHAAHQRPFTPRAVGCLSKCVRRLPGREPPRLISPSVGGILSAHLAGERLPALTGTQQTQTVPVTGLDGADLLRGEMGLQSPVGSWQYFIRNALSRASRPITVSICSDAMAFTSCLKKYPTQHARRRPDISPI